jgi:hypothetical protein
MSRLSVKSLYLRVFFLNITPQVYKLLEELNISLWGTPT